MEIIVPMKKLNGEILYSKQYSNIDLDIFKNIINKGVKFHSPFEDKNSYLNSYSYSEKSKEQNYCGVQFHYLQECDYENGKKKGTWLINEGLKQNRVDVKVKKW